MIEGRVQHRRQQHHGQQEAERKAKAFPPLEIDVVRHGAAQRYEQTDGMHEAHPKHQHHCEIQKIHQRMIAGKCVTINHVSCYYFRFFASLPLCIAWS